VVTPRGGFELVDTVGLLGIMPSRWPELSYERWSATCDTLHAHTQVLGKLAATLAPPEPQLQHAALRLSARGWETLPLPAPDGSGALVVALDLRTHEAVAEHSDVGLFSGRPADPPAEDFITRNAMDAQEIAVGWWPGDPRYSRAAFYAYAHPAPPGFETATLGPAAARWEAALGEYVLDWDDVRSDSAPHEAALEFGRSAVRHACVVCEWDPQLASSADGTPPPVG
jgi:hypothetical protein